MKQKYLSTATMILIVLVIFSVPKLVSYIKYQSQINKFNNSYDQIVNLIDRKNLKDSIIKNDLPSKLIELKNDLDYISNNPDIKLSEKVLYAGRYGILNDIITKGQKLETLDSSDKLILDLSVGILKESKYKQ